MMPEYQRLVALYAARAPEYDEINGAAPWLRLYREQTWSVLREICKPGDRVLDAGGGTGIFASRLALLGCEVVLVDVLPQMVAIAGEKVQKLGEAGKRVRVMLGDISELSQLTLDLFDVIICTQMLNFVTHRLQVFREFRAALKPGGRLLCDIDSAYRWAVIETLSGRPGNGRNILEDGVDTARAITGADYYFCSASTLQQELELSGFVCREFKGLQYFAPYLHVFAKSAEFLAPESLPAVVKLFTQQATFDELRKIEASASVAHLPIELAGWIQVMAEYGSPDI